MISSTQFKFLLCILVLPLLASSITLAQGSFVKEVDRAFGSNQELVNGIQFSNQYIRSEGHPYWSDGRFRRGSICVNEHWYEDLKIRYNLYSQKLELEYLTSEGFMNQIITVPENISAFHLNGCLFRRLQIGEQAPAYYQFISVGGIECYIWWSRRLLGSAATGSRFEEIDREYWLVLNDNWMHFRDRKSYLAVFPPDRKQDFKKLLKQLDFHFQRASVGEMEEMLRASIQLLNQWGGA